MGALSILTNSLSSRIVRSRSILEMRLLTDLIETVKSLPHHSIIGISGFGGSGKSTLATRLSQLLNCSIICVDSFMTTISDNNISGWDNIDYERLISEVVLPFINHQEIISYGHFDSNINAISEEIIVKNTHHLIMEGVGLFRPEVMKHLTFTIWVECPIETAILRGKHRDRFVYQNPHDELWDGLWKNNDLEFLAKYSPHNNVSLRFNNSDEVTIE